ncbi:hypothetical protein Tco_1132340 [Tanacetum coccineum]|uniref:Uncharacterized protein n=1 Tax=Tanacetum coccineum TaxID=301880 RepID=A0ABQ5JFR4_9ASTR
MLSSCHLPKDQASLGVAPTETYKAVNELPKRPTTIYKPNNDPKGLQVDDLARAGRAVVYGSDYQMRMLRIAITLRERNLMDGLQGREGYFEVQDIDTEIAAAEDHRFVHGKGLKGVGLLEEISNPHMRVTLYEQFLAITQEGSAREYVSLFETLAGQLVGIPEQVMEGTFIKGLRPESRSAIRVMQPEGLNHAMKLAMIIMKIRRKVAQELEDYVSGARRSSSQAIGCATLTTLASDVLLTTGDVENEPYLQVKPWDRALKAD